MLLKSLGCLVLCCLITACSMSGHLAPVSERSWQPFKSFHNAKTHVVQKGETLYAIAFRYDTDYRHLAQYNHIRPPYSLRIGQVIRLTPPGPFSRTVRQPNKPYVRAPQPRRPPLYARVFRRNNTASWLWPVSGRIITGFAPTQGKKGIDIACKKGDNIRAAAGGTVAYAGNGLNGYGNLIIIKHNNEYLTAYGNSARNLVSEGQLVKKGQIIAKVGPLKHRFYGLHFEIRRRGNPVNPLNYLR